MDDSAPAISYSGSWQTSSDSRQFASSSHFTTSSGATATINFTGNLVRVVCTNPAVPDGVIRAEFVLDGKVTSFTRTSHSNAFYDDQFFFANGLQRDQQHTLVVRNLGSQVPLHIDYFEIEGGNVISAPQVGPPPPPPPTTRTTPPTTTNTPRPTPPSATATRTIVETSVEVVTSVNQLVPSASSDTQASSQDRDSSSSRTESTSNSRNVRSSSGSLPESSAGTNSGSVTVTAFQIVTTSISGVAVVTTIGSGEERGSRNTSQSLSTGAIIGIIVGSLFLIALIGVLVILLLRKRRRDQDRRSIVRQRLARQSADPLPSSAPTTVGHHGDDMERQSTEVSSVDPPPRLSLEFMRTLHEKSQPSGSTSHPPHADSDTFTNVPPTTAGTSAPNAYAPSFRSSYPLSLPEGAPPAYSSVRMSNVPSSREATRASSRFDSQG